MQEPAAVARQRLASRALLRRGGEVLLARISGTAFGTAGVWTLPGGGVDHGEHPEDSLRREVFEETGLEVEVGAVIGVYSRRFTGRSPTGVLEDFHGVHLVYSATVASPSDMPRVMELEGTTDEVAWVAVDAVQAGEVDTSDVVLFALGLERD